MDLTQLEYFCVAAQTENFTQAARQLFITQPTLSKSIQLLEQDLGVQLFDRVGNRVRLNACGKTYYQHVAPIFNHLQEGQQALVDLTNGPGSSVSLAATQPEMIEDATRAFLHAHPNVHMFFERGNARQMQNMLESRTIDFALSIVPIEAPNILWVPFFREQIGVTVSRMHRLASRSSVCLAELAEEAFLLNNSNDDFRDSYYQFCQEAGFQPKILFGGEFPLLIGQLVSENYGVALVSEHRFLLQRDSVNRKSFDDDVIFVPIDAPTCARTTGVALLKDRYLSLAARIFLGDVVASLGNLALPPELTQLLKSGSLDALT